MKRGLNMSRSHVICSWVKKVLQIHVLRLASVGVGAVYLVTFILVEFGENLVKKRNNLITCLIRYYRAIFLLFFTSSMIIDLFFRKVQDACPSMNVELCMLMRGILHRIFSWSWRESIRSHRSFRRLNADKNLQSFFFSSDARFRGARISNYS